MEKNIKMNTSRKKLFRRQDTNHRGNKNNSIELSQNIEGPAKIMGLNIESSGSGHVDLKSDLHGPISFRQAILFILFVFESLDLFHL
jgi:hypothetical protein